MINYELYCNIVNVYIIIIIYIYIYVLYRSLILIIKELIIILVCILQQNHIIYIYKYIEKL